MASPSTRRSPRLTKHVLQREETPPSKARSAARKLNIGDDSASKTTPTRREGKSTNNDNNYNNMIPFLATTTPPATTQRGKQTPTKKSSSSSTGGKSTKSAVGIGASSTTRRHQTRRGVTISPRTRGSAIASILASPSVFATNENNNNSTTGGGSTSTTSWSNINNNTFLTPSKRSSAEATLHRMATQKGVDNKRTLDTSTTAHNPSPKKRRRRKAASDASTKVRAQLDDFDDLTTLTSESDKIPYNKPTTSTITQGRKKKAKGMSELVVDSNVEQPQKRAAVTIDTFIPKGKIEERWFKCFKKWNNNTNNNTGGEGGTTESSATAAPPPPPSSPLPASWVKEQRAQYKLLMQDKKSRMTNDRMTLLESAGFIWEVRKGRKGKADDVVQKNNVVTNDDAEVNSNDKFDKKNTTTSKLAAASTEVDAQVLEKKSNAHAEDSPSKRKSPRKSPPTQFYHNLEKKDSGESSDKVSSKNPNPEQAKSEKQKVASAAVNASPSTTTKNGKKQLSNSPPKSPSKRSLSTKNNSLASLSANDKTRSDKQKQKKKKRRGRHSTSSLLSLEAHTSEEAISNSDKKKELASVFSHEELKKELIKSKKKPARKRQDGAGEKKMTKKSQTAAKKKSNGTNEDVNDTVTGQLEDANEKPDKTPTVAETTDVKSPPSHQSPLRVTRLLPALDNNESHAKKSGTVDDDEPESVCVTKLLLSCLSEDSAEKDNSQKEAAAGSGTMITAIEKSGVDSPVISTPERAKKSMGSSISADDVGGTKAKKSGTTIKDIPELGPGWEVNVVPRRTGDRKDSYYCSPTGQRFRSMKQAKAHADANNNDCTADVQEDDEKLGKVDTAAPPSPVIDAHKEEEEVESPSQRQSQSTNIPWTCDVCREATFEDYDDAVAHEKECAITYKSQGPEPLPSEEGSNISKIVNSPTVEVSKPIGQPKRPLSPKLPAKPTKDDFLEQPTAPQKAKDYCPASNDSRQAGSWTCDVCKKATFEDYDDAVAHEEKCALQQKEADSHIDESKKKPINKQSKRKKANRSSQPSVLEQQHEEEEVAHPAEDLSPTIHTKSTTSNKQNSALDPVTTAVHDSVNQLATTEPPAQCNDPGDGSSLPLFSPLSLTSPLEGRDLSLVSTSVGATSQNENQVNESQLQMVIAERQYQEKMSEFGRLELEAKMVTQRMREIEERIKGLDSNAISTNGVADDLEEYESISRRKRSYRSESKSRSMRKSRSWSHRYESSEEEYENEHQTPRKRRRIHMSDDTESRLYSAGRKSPRRSDRYENERSVKRLKVQSRSSRSSEGDWRRNRSSYDDYDDDSEMIQMESSRRSKKAGRHRAELISSQQRNYDNSSYHSPGTRKKRRSKGSSKTPVFAADESIDITGSRNKSSRSKRKQQQFLHNEPDDRETESSPDESSEEETEPIQPPAKSRAQSGVSHDESLAKLKNNNESAELSVDDEDTKVAAENISAAKVDGTKDRTIIDNDSGGAAPQQVDKAMDPMYWLAGGESDDESWDFDGAMILPPPPT